MLCSKDMAHTAGLFGLTNATVYYVIPLLLLGEPSKILSPVQLFE